MLAIAAVTSSPKLSDMGDYIFRVTPVSTRLAELLSTYAMRQQGFTEAAMIYELTDYVVPVADKFQEPIKQSGGAVISSMTFNPGETEFKSILLKTVRRRADFLYIGVQAPDTALLLMRQIKELNLKFKVFGNEQFAGAFISAKDPDRALLEGVVFAEPVCNLTSPATKKFAEEYKRRYQVRDLPFGCYTGEPYDAVNILSQALRKCGENVDCVKDYLYALRNY